MRVGIVGFGHLGKSLAKGLILKQIVSKNEIYILAKSENTIKQANDEYGFCVSENINEIIYASDIIFFVVKSNVFEELCKEIDKDLLKSKLLVSFMAGMTIRKIQERLGDIYITRGMPSIAIDRAEGVIAYTMTDNTCINQIFNALGYAFEVEECNIEKATAFASCGLGFAAYILDSFQQVGEILGFSDEVSEQIVARTFHSAIQMSNYKETAKAVATKGGATEQGILCFEENKISNIIEEAINRAYKKMK